MLKISEYNKITGEKIDLKDLEKFGFNPKYDENTGEIIEYYRMNRRWKRNNY